MLTQRLIKWRKKACHHYWYMWIGNFCKTFKVLKWTFHHLCWKNHLIVTHIATNFVAFEISGLWIWNIFVLEEFLRGTNVEYKLAFEKSAELDGWMHVDLWVRYGPHRETPAESRLFLLLTRGCSLEIYSLGVLYCNCKLLGKIEDSGIEKCLAAQGPGLNAK